MAEVARAAGPALWGAPRSVDFLLLAVSRGVYMQVVGLWVGCSPLLISTNRLGLS